MPRLLRVDCSSPGITRRRRGRGFSDVDERGVVIRAPDELERLRALVVPPAWRDVWICADANGHLQAVGTDEAGRRHYLYHPARRARQDQRKFDQMVAFARGLPELRAHVAEKLAGSGLTEDRVLACAVRLLDRGFFRIGGEAQDFRTWHGTVLAAVALAVSTRPASTSGRKRAIARAVQEVSHSLGNTPAVCRASYIDSRVIDRYREGRTIARTLERLAWPSEQDAPATQGPVEAAVLDLLDR